MSRTLGLREGIESTARETEAAASEFQIDEAFPSLLSTTRAVLFSPQRFFDELSPDGPLGAPILYFLICSAITAASRGGSRPPLPPPPVGGGLGTRPLV